MADGSLWEGLQQSVPVQRGLWDGLYDPATGMPYPGNAPDYGDLSQRMTNAQQRLAAGIYEAGAMPGRAFGTVPGGPPTPEEEANWGAGTALGMLGAARLPGGAPAGAAGAGGAKLVQPEGIFAYHSSPYTFDKFDLSKIGTGEGAQVYGHGIYAAENPAVSGQGGQYWQQFSGRFTGPEADAAALLQQHGFDREKALAASQKLMDAYKERLAVNPNARFSDDAMRGRYLSDQLEYQQAQHNLLASGQPVGPRTYEVNINARPEQMLDWDKPLVGQNEAVRSVNDLYWDQYAKRHPDITGFLKSQEGAAVMREAGIPGIRYLDQGSRGQAKKMDELLKVYGSPERVREVAQQRMAAPHIGADDTFWSDILNKPATSNYVIFDPNKLDIRRMYAVPGAVGAGAASTGGMWDSLFPQREEQ